MKQFVNVMLAEIKKIHIETFHSYIVIFSLLIWPILSFFEVLFSFKPFEGSQAYQRIFETQGISLLVFLLTGMLGFTAFWSMVQSAWQMSNERYSGTLEAIFLTPASRLAIMYGRALGSLLSNIWMFSIFSFAIMFLSVKINFYSYLLIALSFVVLLISATIWGGLLNAIFLLSRDSSILMYILNAPVELFSGSRIPVSVLPFWGKLISAIIPLTYCLKIIRGAFNNYQNVDSVVLIELIGSLIVIVILTKFIIFRAEKFLVKNGELNFF